MGNGGAPPSETPTAAPLPARPPLLAARGKMEVQANSGLSDGYTDTAVAHVPAAQERAVHTFPLRRGAAGRNVTAGDCGV